MIENVKPQPTYAFPLFVEDGNWQEGMTLRDYFAAAALQGVLASPTFWGEKFQGNIQQAAFCAYDCADSMLKAREAAAQ